MAGLQKLIPFMFPIPHCPISNEYARSPLRNPKSGIGNRESEIPLQPVIPFL
jgi:hypothetical protein